MHMGHAYMWAMHTAGPHRTVFVKALTKNLSFTHPRSEHLEEKLAISYIQQLADWPGAPTLGMQISKARFRRVGTTSPGLKWCAPLLWDFGGTMRWAKTLNWCTLLHVYFLGLVAFWPDMLRRSLGLITDFSLLYKTLLHGGQSRLGVEHLRLQRTLNELAVPSAAL
eukprot:scaffold40620_cov15-Tisochrysis_lutea.AAC.1